MFDTYTVYHLHTPLSNPTTIMDSVAPWEKYVKLAHQNGMKALGCTEHGNVFSWYNKKSKAEAPMEIDGHKYDGLKYIYGVEAYLTMGIPFEDGVAKPIQESLHCVLLARNHAGFVEINHLVSNSYNTHDGHFYYRPRITWDELCGTSDNVIVTTACLAGFLRHEDKNVRDMMVRHIAAHRDRFFLEVQHHLMLDQCEYNRELAGLSRRYGLKLIAGTDTHATDEFNAKCRLELQAAHNQHFESDECDLTFKTLDELIAMYKAQGTLNEAEYMGAIDNTNALADMIEPWEVDRTPKYPQVYDDPAALFKQSVEDGLRRHPELIEKHGESVVRDRILNETDVFTFRNALTYMLLYKRLVDYNHSQGVYTGPGRGSAAGSLICYLFGITEVDPLEYNLSFARFMSKEKVTLPDIDADYFSGDRDKVFDYILKEKMGFERVEAAQVITYQTIKLRGAIRNVGKALGMDLKTLDEIAKQESDESVPEELRERYPELFAKVDEIQGVVLTAGRHAAGAIIADKNSDMAGEMGVYYSSKTEFPITVLDKKELESLSWVKYDILGLDYVGLVNNTCKLAGIPRLTPSTVDLQDDKVWESIREDTTCIFQFVKNSAHAYIKKILSPDSIKESLKYDPNPSLFQRFALASAMLRPGAASVRDTAAQGIYVQYPIAQLNDALKDSMGTLVYQESLMAFLSKFCGYTEGQSDYVRSCVAKKKGTEQLVPDIRRGFLEYTPQHYGVSMEVAEKLIDPFIQTILDSATYSFSKNHSVPYTMISYMCGWLRYHYPQEFIATAIDTFQDNKDQIEEVMNYASRHGINVAPPKYGMSRSFSQVDKQTGYVYQSIVPIKDVSASSAEILYEVSQSLTTHTYFSDVIVNAKQRGVNKTVLQNLIYVDFFSEFGGQIALTRVMDACEIYSKRKTLKRDEVEALGGISALSSCLKPAKEGAKTFHIQDGLELCHCIERHIASLKLPDACPKAKIRQQMEYLGRINMSGDPKDRFRLYIRDVKPLKRKDNKKVWGYKFSATSLGTGKTQSLTVADWLYEQKPFIDGDILNTNSSDFSQNKAGFWRLLGYTVEQS